MGKTQTSLTYHFVFSTKYRRKMIRPDFEEQLYQYIGGIIRQKKGVLLEIGGIEDHIHLMAGLPPTMSVSDMLRFIIKIFINVAVKIAPILLIYLLQKRQCY